MACILFIMTLWDILLSAHEVISVIAAIIPAGIRVTLKQLPPCFYLPPDPEQPFLQRGSHRDIEIIFINHFSTHVIVPCLVTVPDLNDTLHAVCILTTDFSHCVPLIEAVKDLIMYFIVCHLSIPRLWKPTRWHGTTSEVGPFPWTVCQCSSEFCVGQH